MNQAWNGINLFLTSKKFLSYKNVSRDWDYAHKFCLPLGIPRRSCSFSQDAKVALSASAIFLLVPGVSGGTWDGMSEKKNNN